MKRTLVALHLSVGVSLAFGAAPIYRCGGPDGRTYSQAPCADGQLIDAADPRSQAQRAEAQRVAARERKVANELARERRAQEAAQEPAIATGFNGRPAPVETVALQHARGKPKHRGAKTSRATEDFVAIEPSREKAKP